MAKIRDDLEGVVFVREDAFSLPRPLRAGDTVPDGVTVGAHLLADGTAIDEHDDEGLVEPPREGRGSGKQAWHDYATALGIRFPKDATRDQVIELVDADRGDDSDDPGEDDDESGDDESDEQDD